MDIHTNYTTYIYTLQHILTCILSINISLIIVLVLWYLISYVFGYRLLIVDDISIGPAIPQGGLCLIDTTARCDDMPPDAVVAYHANDRMILLRRHEAEGDALSDGPFDEASLVGCVEVVFPLLGVIASATRSSVGITLATSLTIFVITQEFWGKLSRLEERHDSSRNKDRADIDA